MSENVGENIPQEVLLITGPPPQESTEWSARRGGGLPRVAEYAEKIQLSELRTQINVFLAQMNVALEKVPEKVGTFKLEEFEVSAGFVVEGKGSVKLALIADAEVGGSINASLKFVFKRE